jgi:hypothetical protein
LDAATAQLGGCWPDPSLATASCTTWLGRRTYNCACHPERTPARGLVRSIRPGLQGAAPGQASGGAQVLIAVRALRAAADASDMQDGSKRSLSHKRLGSMALLVRCANRRFISDAGVDRSRREAGGGRRQLTTPCAMRPGCSSRARHGQAAYAIHRLFA